MIPLSTADKLYGRIPSTVEFARTEVYCRANGFLQALRSPLNATYFLRSRRLGFRPWSDADLVLAIGLWGDPEVTRFIGGPFSDEQVRDRLAREIATFGEHGMQYWPVFLLGTGEHVGCCGLRPYNLAEGVLELGFHVRRAHWRQGYAQEAAHAAIGYAFESLGATALFAGHNPANESSRHLLAKLGFRYTHDELYAPTGLYHPSYLLRADDAPPATTNRR